jgi:hypothetical protein
MPLCAFALFQLLSPQRVALSRREVAVAAGLFLLVAVPWHLAMWWSWGAAFFDQYLAYVGRRVTAGLPGHMPGPWYYAGILTLRPIFFSYELALAAVAAVLLQPRKLPRFERAGTLLTLLCLAVALQVTRTKIAWYLLPLYPFLAILVAAMVADLEVLAKVRPRLGAALLLAVFALIGLFAARNAYSLVRMQRGSTQGFFSSLEDRCGGDAVYADRRESAPIHYLTLRYGVREGEAGSATCTVTRLDTPLPEGFTAGNREVLREGGYVLWIRQQETTRPARRSHSSRRGRRGRFRALATARAYTSSCPA